MPKYLGTKAKFNGLDTFNTMGAEHVRLVSDEVMAKCPVTGQPDWYEVEISYTPHRVWVDGEMTRKYVETKSLKMYLQSYEDKGVFAEELACLIWRDLDVALDPDHLTVEVTQKSRGGITTHATNYTECVFNSWESAELQEQEA
jgi:7-cyano-7-deazaguanine reductase